MPVFTRSGDISQIDNNILCRACTSRLIMSIVFRLSPTIGPRRLHFDEIHQYPVESAIGNRPANDSTDYPRPTHINRDRHHKVDEQECEEAEMKTARHESGQQTGEIESVGTDLAPNGPLKQLKESWRGTISSPKLSPIPVGNPGELRATVTNSVTKLRGTEGNEISKFGEFRAIQGN
jgi:hypothetical protein